MFFIFIENNCFPCRTIIINTVSKVKIKTSCKIDFDMPVGEIVRANFSLGFAILIPRVLEVIFLCPAGR